MYQGLAEKIEHLNYVVQRNWNDIPEGDPDHPDLDLFVSLQDKDALLEITKDYPNVDVRYPGDGYYPEGIEDMLLIGRQKYKEFWVPTPLFTFMALYYHNAVHKEGNPYGETLKQMFLKVFPPVKPLDEGVGYYT